MYRIDIEGTDGVGKTTALKYLAQQLTDMGYRVLCTREVGTPQIPVCVELRKLLLNPESNIDNTAMELIFAAMRVQNQAFYQAVQNDYDIVLNDRGWLSHLAYNCQSSPDICHRLYEGFVQHVVALPDAVVFLDAPVHVASERRRLRGEPEDIIEAKGNQFQVSVYNSFLQYIKQYEDKICIHRIDASQELPQVQSELLEVVNWYAKIRS